MNKDGTMSSQTAVNRVKRLLSADKAGHTGTLDPMAEGVLPILVGRAVKASEFLLSGDKHYLAHLRLGETSDTEDSTGNILSKTDVLPSEEEVLAVLPRFLGEILQTPPMYSALKVGGRKLCDMARQGIEIAREPRKITVFSLRAKRLSENEYALSVHCSKGTYIRTLCADIGEALGCGGLMSRLVRTEAAGYPIERATTLASLEEMSESDRLSTLIPTEALFAAYPKVTLPPFFARLARAGQPIYQKKIHTGFPMDTLVTLYDEEGFFAVARAVLAEEGEALKPIRQF